MPNNLIEANKAIFEPNISHLNGLFPLVHPQHCVKFAEPRCEERNFFTNLAIKENGSIIHNKNYALISYEQDNDIRKFIVLVNIDIGDETIFDNTLISVFSDHRAPVFLLLASKGIISPKPKEQNNFYEQRLHTANDNMFNYMDKENLVRSHTIEEIENYFDSFTIFELISNNILFDRSPHASLLFIISQASNLMWLPYNQDTINKYNQIVTLGNSNIPYEYVLSAYTAIQWKYAFKDLYRCIERLFPIGRISDLTEKLTCLQTEDPFFIATTLEDKLKWRSDEESSLIALMEKIDSLTIETFISSLFSFNPSLTPESWKDTSETLDSRKKTLKTLKTMQTNDVHEITKLEQEIATLDKKVLGLKKRFLGKQIYLLRNSFVHYRESLTHYMRGYNFTTTGWNIIIQCMIDLITQMYDNTKFK